MTITQSFWRIALHEQRDRNALGTVPEAERHFNAIRLQPGGESLDPLIVLDIFKGG